MARGSPKPVTVEDEPEDEKDTVAQQTSKQEPEGEPKTVAQDDLAKQPAQDQGAKETTEPPAHTPLPGIIDTVAAPRTIEEYPAFIHEWKARGMPRIDVRRVGPDAEVVDFLEHSNKAVPSVKPEASQESTQSREALSASNLTLANFMRKAYETRMAASKEELKSQSTEVADAKLPQPTTDTAIPTTESRDECEKTEEASEPEGPKRPFTVCCNSCDRPVPDVHFHCSICDDGDFDLCRDCVNRGICCYGDGHWLIKRTIVDGHIKCSSTHIAPKSMRAATTKPAAPSHAQAAASNPVVSGMPALPEPKDTILDRQNPSIAAETRPRLTPLAELIDLAPLASTRTCNCCVQVFPDADFLHCTSCDDYDLCKGCFEKNQHGHHPKHGFTPAVKDAVFNYSVASRLAPGRNARHNAICDGCDNFVRGIRHKCLDCPDWDYCSDCVKDASFIHPNHRFVPIYEPLVERPFGTSLRATHYGICCDGPLCRTRARESKYIVGERYKCAVCHDTDFCANCEASPANTHNKTHPLLKFKTPVRHVSVTTTGEHEDGHRLPKMGDRVQTRPEKTECTKKHTPTENIAATPVQTVVDVHPTEQSEEQQPTSVCAVQPVGLKQAVDETKISGAESRISNPHTDDLVAVFKWDAIKDGSVMQPNRTFEQTWYLSNEGTVPWPAGCSVKFVGGDYMGAVDRNHPAGIHELISASESTICYDALYPGQGFPFTVLMRTPDREGKFISYWRLTTPDGTKFGHKLWCDVTVEAPRQLEQPKLELQAPNNTTKTPAASKGIIGLTVEPEYLIDCINKLSIEEVSQSGMIIPKLEHESPSASIHEGGLQGESETAGETTSDTLAPSSSYEDDFEDCGGEDDWAEDSDGGFMTDEEYDILDASDEEFLVEQVKMTSRK